MGGEVGGIGHSWGDTELRLQRDGVLFLEFMGPTLYLISLVTNWYLYDPTVTNDHNMTHLRLLGLNLLWECGVCLTPCGFKNNLYHLF